MFKPKNLLAIILVIAMAIGMTTSAFAFDLPKDAQGTPYEEAIQTLGSLSIMVGDAGTGDFRPNDTIKRSEFAKIAVVALGLGNVAETAKGTTKFKDVAGEHWASGFINVASTQKIIVGDPEGTFRPDDKISYAEALTILVRVLGYEPSAKAKGGYPTGYMIVAAENNVTKNANAGASEPAKRGIVAQLTFNALTVKLMEQTGFGENPEYTVVEKTLLSDKLKVEKIYAQVTATAQTRLSGSSSLKDDEVEIGNTTYKINNSNAKEYLGFNVIAYVKENESINNQKDILMIRPDINKSEFIDVKGDNIDSIADITGGKELKYWVDKEKDLNTESARIATDAKLIYNGKANAFVNTLIKPSATEEISGKVVLLDNNKDEIYDIVFVTAYENYVVEEISTESHRINDKYGKPSLVLDPDDTTIDFEISKAGKKAELEDLKEWDVLSVAKSLDEKYFNIIVNEGKVTGMVTEKEDDKRVIDGKTYYIAKNYTNAIELQDEGTFYLDIEGKIAAVDASSNLNDNYAYLVDAATSGTIDSRVEVKLFTKEGEVKVLKLADKIKLDNQTGVADEDALAAIKPNGNIAKQLITFEVNSTNEITAIDRAEDKSGSPLDYYKNLFAKNIEATDVMYKSAASKLGSVVVTDKTMVFDIPAGENDPEEYAVRNKSIFENENKYDIIVFDVTEDLTAKAIIVTNSTGNTSEESPIALVDKITTVQNADGVTVQKLYALQDGKMIEKMTNASGVLVKAGGASLEQGDIIQFKTNAKGEIDTVTVLFNKANMATEGTNVISENLTTIYGKVAKKFVGSMNVTVNNGPQENYAFGSAKVYNYDSTKQSSQVTLISATDIQKYDAANPRRVFIRIYKDEVKEIVVIR